MLEKKRMGENWIRFWHITENKSFLPLIHPSIFMYVPTSVRALAGFKKNEDKLKGPCEDGSIPLQVEVKPFYVAANSEFETCYVRWEGWGGSTLISYGTKQTEA